MAIPIWAGRYIGLPFKEHGRDATGLDCWGLVRLVLHEQFGYPLPSYTQEYKSPYDVRGVSALIGREAQKWQPVKSGTEKCADVIVLRLRGQPLHTGLVLGDGTMLHIERFIDSAIERYTNSQWRDRIDGFYRYQNIARGQRILP